MRFVNRLLAGVLIAAGAYADSRWRRRVRTIGQSLYRRPDDGLV